MKQTCLINNFILFIIISTVAGTAMGRNSLPRVVDDGYGDYVLIPEGAFLMGDNFDEGRENERPVHQVVLDAYYIGKFEVSNREYKKFMDDGGYSNPGFWQTENTVYAINEGRSYGP